MKDSCFDFKIYLSHSIYCLEYLHNQQIINLKKCIENPNCLKKHLSDYIYYQDSWNEEIKCVNELINKLDEHNKNMENHIDRCFERNRTSLDELIELLRKRL